ncbi:polyprenyl synthetase family protein [Novosphingobium jiangmenense]|uniref:Polyprenyl synthetase family protein n=1 Tax=Novosphingobium jiangmenense TaxID=2791981 RepID=A0ABS0HD96_9SPHN|nr:farnesyl diphosphate synthase [Novosphingobium jiangmenense]MBF9150233.1 polyprenyl synthetase family protein [Novosphingobium jiangmenense]
MAETGLLKPALKAIAEDIDKSFDLLLPVPGDPRDRLVEAMRYATIGGGKRVRPLLVCATASLFGVSRDAAVRVGTAVEAIHVYSLIHDDLPCMDNDALRHGKPTVHLAFDDAAAVLAGDALHDFAFEVLSDPATSGDPFTRIELIRTLATASGMNGMCGGQMMDIVAETSSFDLPTVTRLQQLKTGALLSASVEMGAILGKVPPEGRTHLRGYARDIGLAFQIADDLLDAEGDEAAAGKALRKDEAQGKETFLSLLGAERAREQARILVDQAIEFLASYGPEADLLRELARFIVERNH